MSDIQIWNKVLEGAVKLPFVNVDRTSFLTKELSAFVNEAEMEQIIENGPIDIINPRIINKISRGCINYHLTNVTITSTIAGVPGGWEMALAVPADIAQFFGHALSLMQKLLYLHGFPSIKNAQNEIDDETLNYMTLFIGVMFGNSAAHKATSDILSQIAKQTAKRLPRQALTKTAWYPIVKQVGKWVGIKVTKDMLGKTSGKILPLLGAPISGGLTYLTFKPMANRLHKHLKEKFIELK